MDEADRFRISLDVLASGEANHVGGQLQYIEPDIAATFGKWVDISRATVSTRLQLDSR